MTRLPFRLPEFAPRITWASTAARDVWEPRIRAISAAWLKVERESVIRGIRPSALQNVTPEQLPALMKELAPHGVIALPLSKSARAEGYQSATRTLLDGEAWDYRVAITTIGHTASWSQAWAESDDRRIGLLLGTPECCRKFFERVWKAERWMDTTVPMFITNEQGGPVNMLWRWLGVRPVSHLPCSFVCEASVALGRQMSNLLPEPEYSWMQEILSWPIKYTSLHGIAEITSPIHRMSVPTDALSEKVEIRYQGTGYPAEGAKGVDFPHKTGSAKPMPLGLTRRPDPKDNGFVTVAAQDAAHSTLLATIAGRVFDTVVDLGCGDGTLLSKIPAKRRVGIEADAARARHARLDRVVVSDCTDRALVEKILAEERPDLVIAQIDRNPPDSLPGYSILSYSYEPGAPEPRLIGATVP